jgi:hypothetical protein
MPDASPDPWTLVTAKRYADAAEAYSRLLADGGGEIALRGRATALLLAGRPAEALRDFRQVLDTSDSRYHCSGDFLDLGTCHWYLSRPTEAVAHWRAAQSAPYTDAAGGVECPAFLMYAGVRLGDAAVEAEAVGLLRNHWRRHQRRVRRGRPRTARQAHEDLVHPGLYAWPGAIVPFLLGKIDVGELDGAAVNTPSDVLRARWQCQADFAAAVRAVREGDRDGFRSRMASSAASPYGELENEFHLARWEVENGFPTQPFAGGTI